MEKPRISAIAAIGENRELGKENGLIWKFEADYERLKRLTKGHPLIMGRKTYESVGVELPYAPSIVITSDTQYVSPYAKAKNTTIVHSLEEAFVVANDLELQNENSEKEVFIFGGAKLYEASLEQVERLYLTVIDAKDENADSFFPDYSDFTSVLEESEHRENGINFRLLTLERT